MLSFKYPPNEKTFCFEGPEQSFIPLDPILKLRLKPLESVTITDFVFRQ